jgi:hypothetical protein
LPAKVNGVFLDSGGKNFHSLYSKYDMDKLSFCKPMIFENIKEGNDLYSDYIQRIDECWLHATNGSDYAKVGNKDNFLKEILTQY